MWHPPRILQTNTKVTTEFVCHLW